MYWNKFIKDESIPETHYGKGQGYFRYYRSDGSFDYIVAVGGKLLRNGGDLPIQGLEDGFQTDRMIEAVQFGDRLFIATGTKLVEYDGTEAKVVEPYKPLPLEALYVGTNGLSENPDQYLQDGEEAYLRIEGIAPSLRIGIVNQPVVFTTYISAPQGATVEYRYEYKKASLDTFLLGRDWATNKEWTWTPPDTGDWQIKVLARIQGSPDPPQESQLPVYKVSSFDENQTYDVSDIQSCNRIMLHYNRLILYGSTKNKNQVYISHLNNPRYFPTLNTLVFESNDQAPLVKLVQYRDFLVGFLSNQVQALYGTGPVGDNPYRRAVLHTGVGCIAPETPKVLGNDIVFLSEDGVYKLKPYGLNEKMNVEKIDTAIANQIPRDEDACAVVYRDQYWICFPQRSMQFRFYRTLEVWTKDISEYLDICRYQAWATELVAQDRLTGRLYVFDDSVFNDMGHVYEAKVVTKKYDFDVPHNPKKLKELHLIVSQNTIDNNISLDVYGDDSLIVSHSPLSKAKKSVEINESSNTVKVPLTPKGKVRVTQAAVRHRRNEPFTLLGIGFVFKLKRP